MLMEDAFDFLEKGSPVSEMKWLRNAAEFYGTDKEASDEYRTYWWKVSQEFDKCAENIALINKGKIPQKETKMKTVYAAQENEDTTEGKGRMRTVALFDTKDAALACAKGRGVMGVGDGDVTVVQVFSSMRDYEENNDTAMRKKALAKLTDYDKKLLGLSHYKD